MAETLEIQQQHVICAYGDAQSPLAVLEFRDNGEGGEVVLWAGLLLEVGNTFPCTVLQGRTKIFLWRTQCTREYFSSY